MFRNAQLFEKTRMRHENLVLDDELKLALENRCDLKTLNSINEHMDFPSSRPGIYELYLLYKYSGTVSADAERFFSYPSLIQMTIFLMVLSEPSIGNGLLDKVDQYYFANEFKIRTDFFTIPRDRHVLFLALKANNCLVVERLLDAGFPMFSSENPALKYATLLLSTNSRVSDDMLILLVRYGIQFKSEQDIFKDIVGYCNEYGVSFKRFIKIFNANNVPMSKLLAYASTLPDPDSIEKLLKTEIANALETLGHDSTSFFSMPCRDIREMVESLVVEDDVPALLKAERVGLPRCN